MFERPLLGDAASEAGDAGPRSAKGGTAGAPEPGAGLRGDPPRRTALPKAKPLRASPCGVESQVPGRLGVDWAIEVSHGEDERGTLQGKRATCLGGVVRDHTLQSHTKRSEG